MKKIFDYIGNVLLWLWQLPQNILALFLEGVLCNSSLRWGKKYGANVIINGVFPAAMTLGNYIFLNNKMPLKILDHEYGHVLQSQLLGPLYLVIIGLPSLLHNIVYTVLKKLGVTWNYYNFYTESWANNFAKKVG